MLDGALADRLVKILGMLGSDFEGERAAAAAKAHALIRSSGLTWQQVVLGDAPDASGWRAMVNDCCAKAPLLRQREAEFIQSMTLRRSDPTQKQLDWLNAIHARVCPAAP